MLTDRFSHMTNFFSLGALACLGAMLLLGASAEAATRADVQQWIIEEAELTKVPPALALAVAKVESNFRDDALGPQGERGVMQIMPATARGEFGVAPDGSGMDASTSIWASATWSGSTTSTAGAGTWRCRTITVAP